MSNLQPTYLQPQKLLNSTLQAATTNQSVEGVRDKRKPTYYAQNEAFEPARKECNQSLL